MCRTVSVFLVSSLLINLSACQKDSAQTTATTSQETALEHALKHTDPTYVCPMHPQIISNEPGSCPICGMNLVEKVVKPTSVSVPSPAVRETYPVVSISAAIEQSMGVRTALVERNSLQRKIQAVSYISYDEDKVIHVHPRAEGWIEKMYVNSEGDAVQRGKPLLELYSPQILAAQEDFLVSLRLRTGAVNFDQQRLRTGGRNRLKLLNVPDYIIDLVEKKERSFNQTPVLAPQDGIIFRLGVRDGMYVKPETELFSIANLSSVWVMIEVFEQQIYQVQVGQKAEIRLPALHGEKREGLVDYIYPELDMRTRTLRVRLRFDNPDRLLKPNMFAEATIYSTEKKDVLTVDRQALIVTGERESVVLALDKGRFQPVDVVSGMRGQDRVEIIAGLDAGDRVVTSGQFLIDSESNLQASFQRFLSGE